MVFPPESRYALQATKGKYPKHNHILKWAGVPSKPHYREPYWYCTSFPVKSLRSKPIRWAQNVPGGSQLWTTWVLREGSPLGQKMEEKAALPEVSKELPRGRREQKSLLWSPITLPYMQKLFQNQVWMIHFIWYSRKLSFAYQNITLLKTLVWLQNLCPY